jgi:hypothetical protein
MVVSGKSTKIGKETIAGYFEMLLRHWDRLYGLVGRVPGYRSRGPGSIPCATIFSET